MPKSWQESLSSHLQVRCHVRMWGSHLSWVIDTRAFKQQRPKVITRAKEPRNPTEPHRIIVYNSTGRQLGILAGNDGKTYRRTCKFSYGGNVRSTAVRIRIQSRYLRWFITVNPPSDLEIYHGKPLGPAGYPQCALVHSYVHICRTQWPC